jgi:uncharacterized protein YecE (DUF72 family)
MHAGVRIGTSGWVYPHWRGLFYPEKLPQRQWLAFYSEIFDTVEINNSFYRLPSPDAFAAWREQATQGFLYAVKASRFLTHMKKLKDPRPPLELFLQRAARLGDHLGPVLYQLPPRWKVDLPRLESFLAELPKSRLHVIEFREQSWLIEQVFRLMERYGVVHCIHDLGTLQVPLRLTAAASYIRFHGGRSHSGAYEQSALEQWARRIQEWGRAAVSVYAYFNNDVGGHAVKDAAALKAMLR